MDSNEKDANLKRENIKIESQRVNIGSLTPETRAITNIMSQDDCANNRPIANAIFG